MSRGDDDDDNDCQCKQILQKVGYVSHVASQGNTFVHLVALVQ